MPNNPAIIRVTGETPQLLPVKSLYLDPQNPRLQDMNLSLGDQDEILDALAGEVSDRVG